MEQNRDLTTLLKDYEIQSRNKFLQRLVCGDEQISPQSMDRLAYYGLSLPQRGSFVVVLVSMDQYIKFSQEIHESERNTKLLQLSERLQEEAFVKQAYQGYLVEAEPNDGKTPGEYRAELLRVNAWSNNISADGCECS
jgi:hypothetical protein